MSRTCSRQVESPTSYLAVGELLSRFIADNPFTKPDLHVSSYTQNLPQTDAVAQNEATTMMQIRRYHHGPHAQRRVDRVGGGVPAGRVPIIYLSL